MKINREYYLKQIRPFYDVDLIKVITGVRRAGKSVLLEKIQDELIASGVRGDHLVYINLEDMDYEYLKTAGDLNREIKGRIADEEKYYIMIDEVQHVEGFEKALASFRATLNVSLFVTGSNSTLLSGELATLLTGRTVEFEVLPFSFSEMAEYFRLNNREFSDDMIFDYIKWGGFPLRFGFHREEDIGRYLETLYDNIVNRDIRKKASRFDLQLFRTISLYVLANAGKEFSADNVADHLRKRANRTVSRQTIYNYLRKMQQAYLIHPVRKYYISGKTALVNNDKYYAVDMGFRIINTNTVSFDDTFFLENVIYNELLVRGYTVYTGRTYKGEVDFVAIRDGKKCFIQVCYLLASNSTIEREFGAFKPISDASPKYVLSLDRLDMSRDGIVHLNIVDFLMHRKDLILT